MMAARISRGLGSKQTRACAAHDSAPLRSLYGDKNAAGKFPGRQRNGTFIFNSS